MKTITAHEAHESFSRWLGEAEKGEEIVITRDGRRVATLAPYRAQERTSPERDAAVERAIRLLDNAPKLGKARRFTRDEMHER